MLEQWDSQTLRYIAMDIEAAAEVNLRSWALKETRNSLTLIVHQWNMLKLDTRNCECWLPGNPNDPRYEFPYAESSQIRDRQSKGGFWVQKLSPRELRLLLDTVYDDHQLDIPRIARQVKTVCRDSAQHSSQAQDELARVTGIVLPRPGYL